GRRDAGACLTEPSHLAAGQACEQCDTRDIRLATPQSEFVRGRIHERLACEFGEFLPGDAGTQQPARHGPQPEAAGDDDGPFRENFHIWYALSHIWNALA